MGAATSPIGASALRLWFLVTSISTSSFFVSANQYSLDVSQSTTLQLSPSLIVEKSPGLKPGSKVVCERVQINGLSRLRNLKKFANSVKVKVSNVNSSGHPSKVEVCFHRNESLGIGMCPRDKWEKLVKGSWARAMSPFDEKLLDIRVAGIASETVEVSLDDEFLAFRIVLLVLGIALMTLASFLSKSLVFYYSGAMTVGIFLVILMVLFQGMKLLPTGRKSSLAIFVYSSIVGVGSFLLRYVPRLLGSILAEIGIGEDMFNPLAIFLLLFLVISGAWLGFWVVRKLVLVEDGSIDIGVSHFVSWSIRIVAAVMILQSSVDPLLAAEALISGIFVSSMLKRLSHPRFFHRSYKKLCKMQRSNLRTSEGPCSTTVEDSHRLFASPPTTRTVKGCTSKSPSHLSDSETFYSTFHHTPERRNFSKDEWEKFTEQSTKKALEGLVSSPDFSKWAVANAERITLAPQRNTNKRQRRWFQWL